jgi:type VI secretion system secreted protein Hcp
MATRLFLQLDGVEGSATDSGAVDHSGWIDISSVSCGINNSINVVDKVKGGTSGEASSLSDIAITKQLDKTSTQLYAYCAVGKVWEQPAVIDVMEEENLLFQIKLHTPALQAISVSGSEGGEPFESIALGFSKIEWKFREDPEQSWNLCTNSGTLEKGSVPAAPA